MDERERRIARVAAVMVQAVECYPEMTWKDAVAVNRGTGWSREVRTSESGHARPVERELDDVSLRRAWDLAMAMRDYSPDDSGWSYT